MFRFAFVAFLSFGFSIEVFAQAICDEDLMSCSNACLAGGLLGALVSKGNSSASHATQACINNCNSRKQQCEQREEAATYERRRIEALQKVEENKKLARANEEERVRAEILRRKEAGAEEAKASYDLIMKEMDVLHDSQINIPPSKTPPPQLPKPAAILSAARKLEETDPKEAIKLYKQLSNQGGKIGLAAIAAMKRFKGSDGEAPSRPRTSYTPEILTSLVPHFILQKIHGLRSFESFETFESILHYYNGGVFANQDGYKNMGGGYTYKWRHGVRTVSIFGGLIPVVTYHNLDGRKYKRQLIDVEVISGKFDFLLNSKFQYVITEDVIHIGPNWSRWQEQHNYSCGVNGVIDIEIDNINKPGKVNKASVVNCERISTATTDGEYLNFGAPTKFKQEFLFVHELGVFSGIRKGQMNENKEFISFDELKASRINEKFLFDMGRENLQ